MKPNLDLDGHAIALATMASSIEWLPEKTVQRARRAGS
jgi:hypothetical protein